MLFSWTMFGLLVAALIAAAVFDWFTGKIPNWLTYSMILAGLILASLHGYFTTDIGGRTGQAGTLHQLGASLLGLAAAAIPAWFVYVCGGLGGGDVKLFAGVGAMLASPAGVLLAAVYTLVMCLIMALVIMLRRKILNDTLRRLLIVVLSVISRVKPPDAQAGPRLPVAVAILVGGTLAAWETVLHKLLPWSGLL